MSVGYRTISDVAKDIEASGVEEVARRLASIAGVYITADSKPVAVQVYRDVTELVISLVYGSGLVITIEAEEPDRGILKVKIDFEHLARGSCECY